MAQPCKVSAVRCMDERALCGDSASCPPDHPRVQDLLESVLRRPSKCWRISSARTSIAYFHEPNFDAETWQSFALRLWWHFASHELCESTTASTRPVKTNSANTGNPSAGCDSLAARRRSRCFVPCRQYRALKEGPGRWHPHLRRAPLCQGIHELPSANQRKITGSREVDHGHSSLTAGKDTCAMPALLFAAPFVYSIVLCQGSGEFRTPTLSNIRFWAVVDASGSSITV